MTFWNDGTFTRTSSVQGLPDILKWHNLQNLNKALDLLIEFKFYDSDFYFLKRSKNCMVATYNFGSVYGDFSKRSRAANSLVLRRKLPNFETIRDCMVVLVTCKNIEEPIKNEGARVVTRFSPIITQWELYVAMETKVLIRSGPKPSAANPQPQ